MIYTDTWTSMGQESEAAIRRRVFAPYQVNDELMSLAKPGALFMHCLPAHRNEEVTADVFESLCAWRYSGDPSRSTIALPATESHE